MKGLKIPLFFDLTSIRMSFLFLGHVYLLWSKLLSLREEFFLKRNNVGNAKQEMEIEDSKRQLYLK